MTERTPGEQPKIGPFSLQVPPPSPNGSRVEHGSPFDPVRLALPGFVVALVLALSAVPRVALLQTAELAQWWRVLIAVVASGLVVGAFQRRSWPVAALLGLAANAIAFFIAYGLVQDQESGRVAAGTIAGDLAGLLAWSAAGGVAAASAFVARARIARRIASRTVKPVFPRRN